MKKLLVCLILGLSLPCAGMQKNGPKTKKHVRKQQGKECVWTITPLESTPEKVKKAKLGIANRLIEAINGYPNEQDLQEDNLGSECIALSPRKLIENMRQTIDSNFSFEEKDVTPEMIKAGLLAAQESIGANSVEKDYYEPISSPLKKEAQQILGNSEITLLQANIDDYAYAKDDVIVVNEEKLKQLAPTPQRRKFILKHELAHIENKDLARKTSLEKLLQQYNLGKQKKVSLVNQEFSPGTKEKMQQFIRIGETFADATACNSPSSAEAAVRLLKKEVEENGEGNPTDHPTNGARLRLAQAFVDLHKAEAGSRKRQASTSPQKPKSVKRALFQKKSKSEDKDNNS